MASIIRISDCCVRRSLCLVLIPYKIHKYSLWTERLIWGVKVGVVWLRVKVQVFLLLFLNCILSGDEAMAT